MERLKDHEPIIPPGIIDRDEDNWWTMLAIAELAGGDWPRKARAAAIALSETDELDHGLDGLLLADIQRVFNDRRTVQIKSVDLIDALRLLDGRPWNGWGKNRANPGLTERDLSLQLKPFEIKPDRLDFGADGDTRQRYRGYKLEWFARAFDTYINDDEPEPSQDTFTPRTPANYPSHCPSTEKTRAKSLSALVPESEDGTHENGGKPLENKARDGGTDKRGGNGQSEIKNCPECGESLRWQPRDGEDRLWQCRKCVPTGLTRIELWDTATDEHITLGDDG